MPNLALREYITLLQTNTVQKIQSLQDFVSLYFLVFGIFMVVALVAVTHYDWRLFRQKLFFINFLLTFIPYDKLNEETTIQMLKNLRNY